MRGTRPVLVTFENFKDRDEVLRKVSKHQSISQQQPYWNGMIQIQVLPDPNNFVIQARMLKKANVHVEEDLSKRTRENRAELRKFMRQV